MFGTHTQERQKLCDPNFIVMGGYISFKSVFRLDKKKMKSLVLMNYVQPTDGIKFRWGVKIDSRDTKKQPLALSTLLGPYRRNDKEFQRTRNLITLKTNDGIKAFYVERTKWKIEIPWIGSLVSRFM